MASKSQLNLFEFELQSARSSALIEKFSVFERFRGSKTSYGLHSGERQTGFGPFFLARSSLCNCLIIYLGGLIYPLLVGLYVPLFLSAGSDMDQC